MLSHGGSFENGQNKAQATGEGQSFQNPSWLVRAKRLVDGRAGQIPNECPSVKVYNFENLDFFFLTNEPLELLMYEMIAWQVESLLFYYVKNY